MSKLRRRNSARGSVLSASASGPLSIDGSNAAMQEQMRASRGEGRGGLLGRLLGRKTHQPQPRVVSPTVAPVEIDQPVPVVEPAAPEILEAPASSPDEELPEWARDIDADEEQQLPTGRELIEGWEQTSKGNCVTVAAIKAAQKTFGPQLVNHLDPSLGVFASAVATEQGGLDIVMRDGFELTVSAEELEDAAESSRFKTDKGREDLLENANQLYAVAAKRAQLEGNDGFAPDTMSYDRALHSLEDGEHTSNVMEQVGRLGLKDHASKVPRSELKHYDSSLSSGAGHAYFVSNGDRDYYGRVGPLGGEAYTSRSRGRFGRRERHPAHSSVGTVLHRHRSKDE